jgi:6-pyruvoyltetrahydropterin/6-carboxytetrahydropterin synthase
MITCQRYHDISCGHRVYGHESKCAHLHGHNYRVTFVCGGALDSVGRVIDFSVIKSRLCMWLEDNFDHRFLIWEKDPIANELLKLDPRVVFVPFNPTAENIARYLVEVVAPKQLDGTGVTLLKCSVEETRKCSAEYCRD